MDDFRVRKKVVGSTKFCFFLCLKLEILKTMKNWRLCSGGLPRCLEAGETDIKRKVERTGFIQPRKDKGQKVLITVFQHLRGYCKDDDSALITAIHSDKTREQGCKLLQGKFHPDTGKIFFTMKLK